MSVVYNRKRKYTVIVLTLQSSNHNLSAYTVCVRNDHCLFWHEICATQLILESGQISILLGFIIHEVCSKDLKGDDQQGSVKWEMTIVSIVSKLKP